MQLVDFLKSDSGCKLFEGIPFAYIKGLYDATHGNPCGGCAFNSECDFLKRKNEKFKKIAKRDFGKINFETNAEIAKRMSKEMNRTITPRQISKMRKRGEL